MSGMGSCRACTRPVATDAAACPACGTPWPAYVPPGEQAKMSGLSPAATRLALFGGLLFVVVMMVLVAVA